MNTKNSEITPTIEDGLLASDKGYVPKTIPVSTNARGLDGEELLPIGLVVCLVTDDQDADFGLYKEFTDAAKTAGTMEEKDALVLAHRVDTTDDAGQDSIPATACLNAQLDRDKVIVDDDFDWSAVQRLVLWPRE